MMLVVSKPEISPSMDPKPGISIVSYVNQNPAIIECKLNGSNAAIKPDLAPLILSD
jgi:hypothetical protein